MIPDNTALTKLHILVINMALKDLKSWAPSAYFFSVSCSPGGGNQGESLCKSKSPRISPMRAYRIGAEIPSGTLDNRRATDEKPRYAATHAICTGNLAAGFDNVNNTGIRNMAYHRRLCLLTRFHQMAPPCGSLKARFDLAVPQQRTITSISFLLLIDSSTLTLY